MGKTLYLQCSFGISGDMTAAALLDLGGDEEKLRKVLSSLPLDGFDVRISRVKKSSIDCCDFDVILDKEHENHDHDMEWLYGDDGAGQHHGHHHHGDEDHDHHHGGGGHHHDHGHHHHEADDHSHGHYEHHHHHHIHRGLREIREILGAADMTERARGLALKIFEILAGAEAKAHGTTADEVHFHEVGAVDSIVDIVSIAVLADDLDIEKTVVTEVCEGRGTIRCAHGVLPIPVPAVTAIVSEYGIPIRLLGAEGEFVTPTGAAVVAALRTESELPDSFKIINTGLGAGKREHSIPGILRAMIIEEI